MTGLSTIGEVIEVLTALEQINPRAKILIDGRPPTSLASYRGDYNHLAIQRDGRVFTKTQLPPRQEPFADRFFSGTYTPGHTELEIKANPSVTQFLKALRLAIGAEFEGYKGGQFQMSPLTPIWVSEHSNVDELKLDRFIATSSSVDFLTERAEYDWV